MIDNACVVFYALAYLLLFAIPICGLRHLKARAPLWLRVSLPHWSVRHVDLHRVRVVPVIPVQSQLWFALKIIFVTLAANLLGALIFTAGKKRQR